MADLFLWGQHADAGEDDFTDWTGTTASAGCTIEVIDAAVHHIEHGAHSLRAAWTSDAYSTIQLGAAQTTLYARMYVKFNSGGPTNGTGGALIWFRNAADVADQAIFGWYNDAGTYRPAVRHVGDAAWTIDADGVLATGTWYSFEAAAFYDAAGWLKLYIDGNLAITYNYASAALTTQIVKCGQRFDWGGQGAATDIYYDCVYIADAGPIGVEGAAPPTVAPTLRRLLSHVGLGTKLPLWNTQKWSSRFPKFNPKVI